MYIAGNNGSALKLSSTLDSFNPRCIIMCLVDIFHMSLHISFGVKDLFALGTFNIDMYIHVLFPSVGDLRKTVHFLRLCITYTSTDQAVVDKVGFATGCVLTEITRIAMFSCWIQKVAFMVLYIVQACLLFVLYFLPCSDATPT